MFKTVLLLLAESFNTALLLLAVSFNTVLLLRAASYDTVLLPLAGSIVPDIHSNRDMSKSSSRRQLFDNVLICF